MSRLNYLKSSFIDEVSSTPFLHTDESTLAARHNPLREVGDWLSCRLRPSAPSHSGPTRIQLLLDIRSPSGHTRRANFPHDLHCPNYIGVFCLDSSSDHMSPGKESLTFGGCRWFSGQRVQTKLMTSRFQFLSLVILSNNRYSYFQSTGEKVKYDLGGQVRIIYSRV